MDPFDRMQAAVDYIEKNIHDILQMMELISILLPRSRVMNYGSKAGGLIPLQPQQSCVP